MNTLTVAGARRVLGVDPGAQGAFALLVADRPHDIVFCDMPLVTFRRNSRTRNEISEAAITEIISRLKPDVAWIENVAARPGQGVTSMFRFGLGLGLVRGVLAGLYVPRFDVTPVEWKRAFRLGPDKQEARALALSWFPRQADQLSRVKDEGRAEAALIAVFGLNAEMTGGLRAVDVGHQANKLPSPLA